MSVLDHQRALGECDVLKSWLKIHDSELMTSAITIKTTHLLPYPTLSLPISRIPFHGNIDVSSQLDTFIQGLTSFHNSTVVERSATLVSITLYNIFNVCIVFNTKTTHTVISLQSSKIAS